MKRNDILSLFRTLARAEGFYGRLLCALTEIEQNEPDRYEEIMQTLEAQNFENPLDVIFYIET